MILFPQKSNQKALLMGLVSAHFKISNLPKKERIKFGERGIKRQKTISSAPTAGSEGLPLFRCNFRTGYNFLPFRKTIYLFKFVSYFIGALFWTSHFMFWLQALSKCDKTPGHHSFPVFHLANACLSHLPFHEGKPNPSIQRKRNTFAWKCSGEISLSVGEKNQRVMFPKLEFLLKSASSWAHPGFPIFWQRSSLAFLR